MSVIVAVVVLIVVVLMFHKRIWFALRSYVEDPGIGRPVGQESVDDIELDELDTTAEEERKPSEGQTTVIF